MLGGRVMRWCSTLTHNAQQTRSEKPEIIVHGAFLVDWINEHSQPWCHIGL